VRFAGYAEGCVRYALWNLFKRERRHWQRETLAGELPDENGGSCAGAGCVCFDSSASPAEQAEHKEEAAALAAAVAALPVRQREALWRTMVRGEGLAEAGRAMGVSLQAVNNLRQRGLARLKNKLAGMY